jgi:pimeloyl-ACP methyl ester carboxylesterase
VPPERIILYGYSVGTGPSVYLAARRPVAGLILESPFVSTFRVMTKIPLFPVDKLRNLHEIKRVHCPVLVLHGTRDTIIPFWHGQQVFAASQQSEQRGHIGHQATGSRLTRFIQRASPTELTRARHRLPLCGRDAHGIVCAETPFGDILRTRIFQSEEIFP